MFQRSGYTFWPRWPHLLTLCVVALCAVVVFRFATLSETRSQKITWQFLANLPAKDSQPEQQPTAAPYPIPEATMRDRKYVEYLHLTTISHAATILAKGIQPVTGPLSQYDKRFFALTLSPRYAPATSPDQLASMLQDLERQLRSGYGEAVELKLVHILLPEDVVASLERQRLIVYGPFFPDATPGYTESIFDTASSPTVNAYRNLWSVSEKP